MLKNYRFIHRVGIELEGGWNGGIDFQLDHDGSVNVDADNWGELPSPPIRPAEIEKWMMDHYPDACNATCGMHVHVSVNQSLHYARLMEKQFHEHLKKSLKAWGEDPSIKIRENHPFWERLAGLNRFCLDKHIPEAQIFHREKSETRYTQLNYTWERYRTVECRILPMFKHVEIAILAVFAVVDAFETYLRVQEKEKSIEVALEEDLESFNIPTKIVLEASV